jgi:hypothetical protein
VHIDLLDLSSLLERAESLLTNLESYQRYAEALNFSVSMATWAAWRGCESAARQTAAELAHLGLPIDAPHLLATIFPPERVCIHSLREWLMRMRGQWATAVHLWARSLPDLALPLTVLQAIVADLQKASEPAAEPAPGPAMPALLSAPDLARWLDLPTGRVESMLRRFRDKKPDCVIDLNDVDNLRMNEPRYLSRTAVVMSIFQDLQSDEG